MLTIIKIISVRLIKTWNNLTKLVIKNKLGWAHKLENIIIWLFKPDLRMNELICDENSKWFSKVSNQKLYFRIYKSPQEWVLDMAPNTTWA